MWSGGSNTNRNNNFRGGRFNRGGGGGGRNPNTGRNSNSSGPNQNPTSQEPPLFEICRFFVRSGSCRNGNNCRYYKIII